MKPITLVTACATVLSFFGLLGCGTNSKLQSIQLTAGGATGTFELKGIGNQIHLNASGLYTNTKTVNLTQRVRYSVTAEGTDVLGNPLPPPPLNVSVDPSGVATAVEPFVCTFTDTLADKTKTPAAYAVTGDYKVVATFDGVTSNAAFITVSSALGDGPNGGCGN